MYNMYKLIHIDNTYVVESQVIFRVLGNSLEKYYSLICNFINVLYAKVYLNKFIHNSRNFSIIYLDHFGYNLWYNIKLCQTKPLIYFKLTVIYLNQIQKSYDSSTSIYLLLDFCFIHKTYTYSSIFPEENAILPAEKINYLNLRLRTSHKY